MQDKLIEAAQHVVDEMERGYPILGPVCRLKEALAAAPRCLTVRWERAPTHGSVGIMQYV